MKLRKGAFMVVPLVVASVLVGCGAATSGPKGEPALPASIAPVTQAKSLQVPLMAYEATSQEQLVAAQAATKLMNQCLERFGLPGNVPSLDGEQPLDTDPSKRYGLVSEQDAQYNRTSSTTDNDKEAGGWNPTAQQIEVLNGETATGARSTLKDKFGNQVPEFGCGGEAWDQIVPHRVKDGELLGDALSAAQNQMQADSRFIELGQKWAQCMAGFGYTFSKRLDAAESIVDSTALSQQIQVTKHDLECAQKVNYVGVANAIDTAYQHRYIDEHADAFAAVARHKDEAIKKANEVLSGGK